MNHIDKEWVVANKENGIIYITEKGDEETRHKEICVIYPLNSRYTSRARLIAAAPENTNSNIYMTSAVKKCIEVLKEHVLPDSKLSDTDALLKIYGILDNAEMVDKLKFSETAIKKATE